MPATQIELNVITKRPKKERKKEKERTRTPFIEHCGKLAGDETLHVWLDYLGLTHAYDAIAPPSKLVIHKRNAKHPLPASTCFPKLLVGWASLGYMQVANTKKCDPGALSLSHTQCPHTPCPHTHRAHTCPVRYQRSAH